MSQPFLDILIELLYFDSARKNTIEMESHLLYLISNWSIGLFELINLTIQMH